MKSSTTTKNLLGNNQLGSSLLQAMLLVALMGSSSVTMMKLFENGQKSERSVSIGYQVASLMEEIKTVLSDSTACSKSLEGGEIYPTSRAPASYAEIKNKFDDVKYSLNKTYRDGTIQIKAFELGPFQGDPSLSLSGAAELKVVLEKQGSFFGAKDITRTIELQVALHDDVDPTLENKVATCRYGQSVADGSSDPLKVQALIEESSGGHCFESSSNTCSNGYVYVNTINRTRCTIVTSLYSAGGASTGTYSFLTNGICPDSTYLPLGTGVASTPEVVHICCRQPISF